MEPDDAVEATPLLRRPSAEHRGLGAAVRRLFSVENRILLAGFLITLSFSFTQVPIFYVFHLMECDVYYSKHPPYTGPGDRCSRDEIAAGTATQFSILGMSTTLCGTINLFIAGWTVKKIGPRAALLVQTLVPAIRVSTQILGVFAGGQNGMTIIQATQLITVIGGPAGYILIINIIAGELVEPARRTIVFGMLQGVMMLAQGIGYLSGGMIGDAFGIQCPFQVAFCSFLLSSACVAATLPYISPESMSSGASSSGKSASGFFTPLKIIMPQKLRLANGKQIKHHGVLFLCIGIFVGVLATGYASLLIQMYATAAFEFTQADNGWLMSEFAFVRSLFLMFIFPPIITWGRKWFVSRKASRAPKLEESEIRRDLDISPGQFDATAGTQADEEPVILEPARNDRAACAFDLSFLRWSLVVDGAMTTIAAFATQSWHIYLAGFLLPFGSGTAPAAKGVITEMASPSQRADALSALTLVENVARLATQGLFGFVFAALAEVGKAYLTFFCNAAVACLGVAILYLSHFPPEDSILLEEESTVAADNNDDD